MVSQAIADEHDLRIGQGFMLPSPRPTVLRVAALSTNVGWPPGAIILNAEDYARAWGGAEISAYGIALRPGVSPQVDAARSAGARPTVGADRWKPAPTGTAPARGQPPGTLAPDADRALVLIAAILAMATAMGAMIWQRRPLLADMKVDGFGKGVLWRALLVESALLLGAGCSVGAVFGLYGQLLLSHALVVVTGFPVVLSIDVLVAIGSFLLVTTVAVLILAVPGYLAARVRAAIVLQD